MNDGIFSMTEGIKGQSNVVVKSRNPIVQGNRLADQLYCHVSAADLVGDDAKKMKAIDMILIDGEDCLVVALGFGKLAGLVMSLRSGKQFRNPDRAAEGCARCRRSGGSLPLFGGTSSLFSVHGEVPGISRHSPMSDRVA
jgi:hypothetical protein